MTPPGWILTERDVIRLLALTPRRTDQLRRLQLLNAPGRPDQYTFRDLVALRVDAVKFGSIPDETVPSNVKNH